MDRTAGCVTCVIVNSASPFKALALMGCARVLVFSPNLLANPQSIKLSSAPESIKTSNVMAEVLCFTWMEVKTRAEEAEAVDRLSNRAVLAGQAATR